MKILFILVLIIFPMLSSASTDPQSAYNMMKEGHAVIIDVREKDEINQGMVKMALWFPMSKVKEDKDWEKDFRKITEGKKIFLYCRSGRRSGKLLTLLKTKNIESENLGGFETLKKELPTVVPDKK